MPGEIWNVPVAREARPSARAGAGRASAGRRGRGLPERLPPPTSLNPVKVCRDSVRGKAKSVIARSEATKQSKLASVPALDCSHGDGVCQISLLPYVLPIRGPSRPSTIWFWPARSKLTFGRRSEAEPHQDFRLRRVRLERTGPFSLRHFEAMQSIGSSTRIGRGLIRPWADWVCWLSCVW